jgi:hypothetical protein
MRQIRVKKKRRSDVRYHLDTRSPSGRNLPY